MQLENWWNASKLISAQIFCATKYPMNDTKNLSIQRGREFYKHKKKGKRRKRGMENKEKNNNIIKYISITIMVDLMRTNALTKVSMYLKVIDNI